MGYTVLGETLFEISWEVCNKVGGIYSVISSKAPLIRQNYKEYICIGPYFKKKAQEDFKEEEPPQKYKQPFNELRDKGIFPHYGAWQIKGEPKAILLESEKLAEKKNNIKTEFWKSHWVDSLFSGWEFEEPMLFSYAAALMLESMEKNESFNSEKTILHAHEWLSGFTILHLKNIKSKISTVFTTHATMLGRTMCANHENLYDELGNFNPEKKAKHYNIIDKHSVEKASAHATDIFTTVSEITGKEAEFILGRKPDVLVLNGFDMEEFPSIEETSIKHVTSRNFIREFLTYTFFPYYRFDLKHNLSFYLAGRYEFENKGIDVFIEALGKLNVELKRRNSERTISAFIFLAMPNNGAKVKLLENKNYYTHIKNYVHSKSDEIMDKIIVDFVSSGEPTHHFFTKEFLQEMKKDSVRFKRKGAPIFCTHRLNEYEYDNSVIKAFEKAGLRNLEEDKIKAILFPAFLDGDDSLLNMEFYDTIAGCHLGVFPSYYEPWGYTPMESAALGVTAITTDVAGFGKFIEARTKNFDENKKGVYIIKRNGVRKEDTVEELFQRMLKIADMSHEERVENKVIAKNLANQADWNILIKNYFDAHNKAIEKKKF